MFKFIHHLLNPHCEHCKDEREESKHCESCDTLRRQLEIKTHECQTLLDRLLNPIQPEVIESKPVNVTRPMRNTTWGVRRQLLEQEDKKKAEILKQVPKPMLNNGGTHPNNPDSDIEQLEKELGVDNAIW